MRLTPLPPSALLVLVALVVGCRDDADPDGDGFMADDVADVDCAPLDRSIHPGAHEFCNGVDDDCDGVIDETFDLDADTYLADETDCRALGVQTDCDDTDATVHPNAVETCDGTDEDCSGRVDDTEDRDGDGFSTCDDCDDTDPFVSPDMPEACDGLDNDCSGAADEPWDDDGDGASDCGGDCDDTDPLRSPGLPESCDGVDNNCDDVVDEGFDADGDGVLTCRGDCDDDDPTVYIGAPEACDGVDNDCDATTVEDGDLDADGFTLCDGDCNDNAAAALPGNSEVCDGLDNDCNGATDELAACYGCVDSPPYVVCASAVDWASASSACTLFGRSIVVINSGEEAITVGNASYTITGSAAWIGYTDSASEGTWAWVDASTDGYTAWWSGEPNDSGGEDCAGINFGAIGYWNDYQCASVLPFVCE